MTWAAVGVVVPWVIVLLAAWLGYRLLIQNGRILLRVTSLEVYLEALDDQIYSMRGERLPEGLPVGNEASPFTLPDLSGAPVSLEQFRGRRVLLVFWNPECSFCRQMAPEIAALPPDGGPAGPVPVLISTGTPEANRALAEEHGIRCPVLLQKEMEVADRYGALGTPLGYIIDEQGRTASRMAHGAANVLALARLPDAAGNGEGWPEGAEASDAQAVTPMREHEGHGQRLPFHRGGGLRPGLWAPRFSLPRLDGGRLALEEYRGRRLLLVFSDPQCPTCDEVVPELEQLHRRSPGFEILMVTRGEPDANRAKVAALGLTFPVALQRRWEASRLYRKFVTPAAYLIDEEGRIASDVAVGGAILKLAARAVRAADKEVVPMRWRSSR